MIQPTELRLNNHVISKRHDGLITEVRDLSPTSLKLWANPFANYKYEDIDGIPLTPEILEKAGFIKSKHIDGYTMEDFPYLIFDSKWWALFKYSNDGGYYRVTQCDYEYLHQLQNLFWCLTGSELTVNL